MPTIGTSLDDPAPSIPVPPPPPLPGVGVAGLPKARGGPGVTRKRWWVIPPVSPQCPRREVALLVTQLRHSLPKEWMQLSKLLLLAHYEQVTPLIQDGPMCGLVALCMASSLVGTPVSIDKALETSRARNYTIQGEMFSASLVGELATDLCGCQHVVSSGEGNYDAIVHGLLNRNIILIPYDSDRNHVPGLQRGHKAHWAVLSGILQAFDVTERSNMGDHYVQDEQIENLYHWTDDTCSNGTTPEKPSKIASKPLFEYVFAKQGKSAHTKLWDLKSLLESNRNLFEVGDNIMNDREHFVIPAEGIDKTLCDLIVTLERVTK